MISINNIRPLIIFEKPAQARQICKAFPMKDHKEYIEILPNNIFSKGAIGVWCVGHILKLVDAHKYDERYSTWSLEHLPIIPERFKLEVEPSKSKVFNTIKKWVNDPKINYIIHAGDPAREGSIITSEVIEYIGVKKPQMRFWCASLTKPAVLKAFQQLRDISYYKNTILEGKARQQSDWVIGINLSRAFSLLMNEKGVVDSSFSIGRVQIPLVAMIYNREKQIRDFKSVPYWKVVGEFKNNNDTYTGTWFIDKTEQIFEESKAKALQGYCLDKEARVLDIDKTSVKVPPPQFYNLTALQEEGNKRYKYSPDEVLKIAQKLYLKGVISYPRAQPRHVSENEAAEFPSILSALKGIGGVYNTLIPTPIKDISGDKRFVDGSKTDDHYAIIPTLEVPQINTLSEDEKKIYHMITTRFIAAHYPPAIFNESKITTLVDEQFTFSTKGKILIDSGWNKVINYETEKKDDLNDIQLPIINVGDTVIIKDIELVENETKPPPRYTQGQLVKIMEQAGRLVAKEDKNGVANTYLSLGTVATRANIINQVIAKSYIRIKDNLVYLEPKGECLINSLGQDCWITSPMTTGHMEKYLEGIGKGKKKVSPFINRVNELVKNLLKDMLDSAPSWEIDGELLRSSNKTRRANTLGPCRICGNDVVDKGKFYGCISYKETGCDFSIPKKLLSRELSPTHIKNILETGNSGLITNFKKKKSEDFFDAFLIWNENKKVLDFSYPPKKK